MNKETQHKYGLKKVLQKIDATDKAVGRLASEIALILMGKNKANYSPQTDCGDLVEVSNIKKLKFTGDKLDQKEYIHHTNHPGGLKYKKMSVVFKKDPAEVLTRTVFNMLPVNHLRDKLMKRIKFVK